MTSDGPKLGRAVAPPNPGYVPIPPEQGTKEFPLYLSGSRKALLRIPEGMTEADFNLLRTQLDTSLSVTAAATTSVSVEYFPGTSSFKFNKETAETVC